MTEITIIQPDSTVPIGRIAPWLHESGATYATVRIYREPVPVLADCGDGIIILGGAMDALNEERHRGCPQYARCLTTPLFTTSP